MNFFSRVTSAFEQIGNKLQSPFLLFLRLFFGYQFMSAGFQKLIDIAPVAAYFETLNIPLPLLNANLAGSAEFFGGLFLLFGLLSRVVAIPLIFTMLVALLTANYDDVVQVFSNPVNLLTKTAFPFLLASLTIFIFGPGYFSFDYLLTKSKK